MLFAYVQLVPLLTLLGLRVTLDSLRFSAVGAVLAYCSRRGEGPSRGDFFGFFVLETDFFGISSVFFSRFLGSNSEHRIPTASQRLRSGLKRGLTLNFR